MARPIKDSLKVVRSKKSDGSVKEYFYDRASRVFLANDRALALRLQAELAGPVQPTATKQYNAGTLSWLIEKYKESPKFINRKPNTKDHYDVYFRAMRRSYGDWSIHSFKRSTIDNIRKGLEETPVSANHMIGLFRILFKHAIKQLEVKMENPAEDADMYKQTPRDQVWSDEDIEVFLELAPKKLRLAMAMLLHTAQRTSDVLAIKVSQVSETDGRLYISLLQEKTNKPVRVPVHRSLEPYLRERLQNPPAIGRQRPEGEELRSMVKGASQTAVAKEHGVSANAVRKWLAADLRDEAAGIRRRNVTEIPYLIYNSEGTLWKRRNFSRIWDSVTWKMNFRTARKMLLNGFSKAEVKAHLEETHLVRHDLRRTGIVRMAQAGATTLQIAAVSGHSVDTCQKILETYVPRRSEIALGAIRAWEESEEQAAKDRGVMEKVMEKPELRKISLVKQ